MRSLLGAALASCLASAVLAVKVHHVPHGRHNRTSKTSKSNQTAGVQESSATVPKGDDRVYNLKGERFTVSQPGNHILLRVPQDPERSSLLSLHGQFMALEEAPCDVFMKLFTVSGDWLHGKVIQVHYLPLAIKVSSKDPPFAGSWRSVSNLTDKIKLTGQEALPETVKIKKIKEGQGIDIRVGPKQVRSWPKRPWIQVIRRTHGLDLSLWRLSRFNEDMGGLLGNEHHSMKVEAISTACRASRSNASSSGANLIHNAPPTGSMLSSSWNVPLSGKK